MGHFTDCLSYTQQELNRLAINIHMNPQMESHCKHKYLTPVKEKIKHILQVQSRAYGMPTLAFLKIHIHACTHMCIYGMCTCE